MWIISLVLLLCILFSVGGFLVCSNIARQVGPTIQCSGTFELASTAVLAYASENDNTLPNADTWQEDVRPYYERLYQKVMGDEGTKEIPGLFRGTIESFIPKKSTEPWTCQTGTTITVITFNSDLSGKKFGDIADRSSTVMLWEMKGEGINMAAPYTKPGDADRPSVGYSPRDWFVVYADGGGNAHASSTETNLGVSIEDAKSGTAEPAANAPANSP